MFLGVKATFGEHMVGTPAGVVKTRTMARKSIEERSTPRTLEMVGGVTWRLGEDDPEMDGGA